MLKPVTILALDDVAAPLAHSVQQRIAATLGVDDLVQARTWWTAAVPAADVAASRRHARAGETPARQPARTAAVQDPASVQDLARTIQSVHAHRQRPDSPLRLRDDISTRELVLVMLSAAGPARSTLVETTRQIREIYTTRRFASLVAIEILCLLPEVVGATSPDDYAAAYALLKTLSAEEEKPFDEVWLLDATNASRVHLGALAHSLDSYAGAIAGALTYEPEMSGALPGIHPRGMHPTFSTFGYASLVFPRDTALQRLELRFARELIEAKLLGGEASPHAQLAARQFVAGDAFALPLARIGVDAGQSLFRRFQPKTQVTERTRSAEEVIAAVRGELQAFRDSTQLRSLETLAKQSEETVREHATLLERSIDETLDRDGYEAAMRVLEALLDPLPELRADAELAPRNLVTEVRTATAALDARLRFAPNTASSDAARKRVRELETSIQDQRLVADTVAVTSAEEQLDGMQREKESLLTQVPELLFAEERENNAARNAAREAESARLAEETEAREQELRELFVQLPRAEQALREALETRRAWLWQQVLIAIGGVALMVAIPYAFGALGASLGRVPWAVAWAVVLFAIVTAVRYVTRIAPLVRAARDRVALVRSQIAATDQAGKAAHNAELQFEYDVAHRRKALHALREVHEAAKNALDALRARRQDLADLAASLVPASIVSSGLSLAVVEDGEVDAWYQSTAEDRKPFVRELPVARSASRRLGIDELRRRIAAHASTAFAGFRKLTLATAAATVANDARLAQRLKRFVDASAPLIEVRDDDLPAQKAMQRDCTLWADTNDATWIAQLQRRFPEAHVKAAPDALCAHAVTRVLHYPGYVVGQIEYYHAQYEAATRAEGAEVADLVPAELVVGFMMGAHVRAAYEQLLLGRALGIVTVRGDRLFVSNSLLGDSSLAAAQTLALPGAARELLDAALAPRLDVTRDVSHELRSLRDSAPLTPLDRNVLDGLLKKYATLV